MWGGNNSTEPVSPSATKQTESSSPQTPVEPKPIEYIPVDVTTMVQELENNAAAAQKKYKGQYVKVSGRLGTIDSDMDYISIKPEGISFSDVQCFLKKGNAEQENYVMGLSKDQWVTAYGQITDVGEIMGYSMHVDKFE